MLRHIAGSARWRPLLPAYGRCLTTAADEQPAQSEDNAPPKESVKRKRGRPRKAESETPSIPATLTIRASQGHNDLSTFLVHAERTSLSPESPVYKGTHYEYTVASALGAFNFTLHRTGRANDLGIDLVGTFAPLASQPIPLGTENVAPEMRVIAQCKAIPPQPSMVRELEGAYVGAPAGWRDGRVLALLVASGAATKGVREAVQRSRLPMGLMQVTKEGWMKQWIWNAAAAAAGLEGVGVVARHGGKEGEGHGIAMTWMGKVVKVRV